MECDVEQQNNPPEFPDQLGDDYELWRKYREKYGGEAYKYRRLYEETARQLANLYRYAQENDIELPWPGPDFT